jgi:hypothetical protein
MEELQVIPLEESEEAALMEVVEVVVQTLV